MLIQITTGFKVIPIKDLGNRVLCKYAEDNSLYKKNRETFFYKVELRQMNLFDLLDEIESDDIK